MGAAYKGGVGRGKPEPSVCTQEPRPARPVPKPSSSATLESSAALCLLSGARRPAYQDSSLLLLCLQGEHRDHQINTPRSQGLQAGCPLLI